MSAPVEPCAWCGGDEPKSSSHPEFCRDCVQVMLRNEDEPRRDLYRNVTDLLPAEPTLRKGTAMIQMSEGISISLDSHLTDLLDWYTIERNNLMREALVGKRENPYPPEEVSMEDLARELLRAALHEWVGRYHRQVQFQLRQGAGCRVLSVQDNVQEGSGVQNVQNGMNAGSGH